MPTKKPAQRISSSVTEKRTPQWRGQLLAARLCRFFFFFLTFDTARFMQRAFSSNAPCLCAERHSSQPFYRAIDGGRGVSRGGQRLLQKEAVAIFQEKTGIRKKHPHAPPRNTGCSQRDWESWCGTTILANFPKLT
ncbi:uncharacterized protein TM35_000064490 [Trypanosoma theileri]|uniref:Uncharacterized protein n=1 Tax=Trypanosoma theileri TaxID=67003 RepID=A0A1X0P3C7_9TRYP|nr:uncharacterized protein TM35_000064490 [Trypanosoma theileri]ORC91444.1 hypothetical protein TM35_000064490 [Trypanosoma theileri]